MPMKMVRLIGGPGDGEVHTVQPGEPLLPDGSGTADVFPEKLQAGVQRVRAGRYTPLGFADENGNEMFRWVGWEE